MQDSHDENIISLAEIKKIAKLSNLEFHDHDITKMTESFSNILQLFSQLSAVNVDTIEVSYESCKTAQNAREDIIIPEESNAKISTYSAYYNKKTHLIDVPPVIETE